MQSSKLKKLIFTDKSGHISAITHQVDLSKFCS